MVRKGPYKGDVGFVAGIESWGVEVLLVPCLAAPLFSLKRKQSTVPPPPVLFDPPTFYHQHKILRYPDGSYLCNSLTFECGLLRKGFDFHLLSTVVLNISSQLSMLFQDSQHPRILASTFPPPQEWNFEEGEKVFVHSANRNGSILSVGPDILEVDLGDIGTVAVPWYDVQKVIKTGDFFTITGGDQCGTSGWVNKVDEDIVHIVEKCVEGEITSINPSCAITVFYI